MVVVQSVPTMFGVQQPATTPPPSPPREPEIEFLGKVVAFGLLMFRAATVTGALVAVAYGVANIVDPPYYPFMTMGVGGGRMVAPFFVWFCIGIPPLLPVKWLFGGGRWSMLLVGIALWFGPMWLEGDHDYGFILRFFASLVAVSVLLVWKTVFALTQKHPAPAPPR